MDIFIEPLNWDELQFWENLGFGLRGQYVWLALEGGRVGGRGYGTCRLFGSCFKFSNFYQLDLHTKTYVALARLL